MRDPDKLFAKLRKSPFRSRFTLRGRELLYLREKGIGKIMDHAREFVDERLAPSDPPNDGKQTPMRNHPVFIAQHATATCCRKCLMKWHGIPAHAHALTGEEKDYVISLLRKWMEGYL
ncbi:MAG TPA: DUF4186 domain-containing protein [Thermodesulfobacteriota bacterium]|nr:DUF4186 domain-containing protein [Thermodesulfobacteriota bacterium]